MVTFTYGEELVLDRSLGILEERKSRFAPILRTQVSDLEQLAAIVDRAPSPRTDLYAHGDDRSIYSLTRKLCDQGVEHVVNLPTKAVLGHGFTVMKLHVFGFLSKLVKTEEPLAEVRGEVEMEYNDLLFTLMAEDLYTSLVSHEDVESLWVQKAAHELITMWDMRTSGYLETFALAIRELWQVRHAIVPILGTLLGTMELMRLSVMLPPVWLDFISDTAGSIAIVSALEEFIFDLSFEELTILRKKMEESHISLIDRNTAWLMLDKHEAAAVDANAALALYKSYMNRQQLAKRRTILSAEGPHKSLEEYFLIHLLSSEQHAPKFG